MNISSRLNVGKWSYGIVYSYIAIKIFEILAQWTFRNFIFAKIFYIFANINYRNLRAKFNNFYQHYLHISCHGCNFS